jgi:hypothetical protein
MLERRQRFLEKALLGNETVYVLDDGAVLRFSDGVVETSASRQIGGTPTRSRL